MGAHWGRGNSRRGRRGVSRIPREARDGLMRAWLEILRERHPGVSWVPGEQVTQETAIRGNATSDKPSTKAESVSVAA